MSTQWIKNYNELATSDTRAIALAIAQAGLDAISTDQVLKRAIRLEGSILYINDNVFDLSVFKTVKVVGFGKCACEAAIALEEILQEKITEGVVIGLAQKVCPRIKTFAGTHPRPSMANVASGKELFDLVQNATADDLIIAIVSGGGSALLCYPESECVQGEKLYDTFLRSGKTINELNTIRKHLSLLKGGGLAKLAYPATVIGLIFSDVPGDHFEEVASGPTYKDSTTIADAQRIIDTYNLGTFDLIETPKEDYYFEKVHNIVLVSNRTALDAMAKKVHSYGLTPRIVSSELYSDIDSALELIFSNQAENTVVLAAGEPKLVVTEKGGSGGRNLYMGLKALSRVQEGSVFIPLASDGMDNSDCAGAIIDTTTTIRALERKVPVADYLKRFDAYKAFEQIGDMIMTGPTNANVSDIMILVTTTHAQHH